MKAVGLGGFYGGRGAGGAVFVFPVSSNLAYTE